jgi:hypothetical protein
MRGLRLNASYECPLNTATSRKTHVSNWDVAANG